MIIKIQSVKKKGEFKSMVQDHAFRVGVFPPPQIRLIFEFEIETLFNSLNSPVYKVFRVKVLTCTLNP